jgi:uncharacterized membrane protein
MRTHFSIWRTTILGGVLFLLPFALVVFLVGQIAHLIYTVAAQMDSAVPDWLISGVPLAVLLAAVLLLVLCYAAGLAARRSLGRQFSEKLERNIMLFFPRYAIWKSQLATNFGADQPDVVLQPVLVSFDEWSRLGFEIERTPSAEMNDAVTVYLPGSPDVWAGQLVQVSDSRVKPLPATFAEAAAICESMGRGAGVLLRETGGR